MVNIVSMKHVRLYIYQHVTGFGVGLYTSIDYCRLPGLHS